MNEVINKFLENISKFKECWNQIDAKVISVKIGDQYANLISSLTLEYEQNPKDVIYEGLPYTDKINVLYAKFEIAKLSDILNNISNGIFVIQNKKIIYGKSDEIGLKYQINFREHKILIGQKFYLRQNPFSNFILESYGSDSIRNISRLGGIDDIDSEILKFSQPYENLYEFVKSFFNFSTLKNFTYDYNTLVILSAPLKIYFTDKCNLSSKQLHIEIYAEIPEINNDMIIKIINYRIDEEIERHNFPLPKHEWEGESNSYRFDKNYHYLNSHHVKLRLEYKGELINETEIINPEIQSLNIRAIVHLEYDKNFDIMQSFISGGSKQPQRDFEISIAWLLHICGLNVADYGILSKISDSIDLIAFSPIDNRILSIECTTNLPDKNDKLAKLFKRTTNLQEKLPDYILKPIMITSLSNHEIPQSEYDKADTMNIDIVTQEKIAMLLDLSRKPSPVVEVLDLLWPI